MPITGIDVSHYQGVIDWQQVATTGLSFAYAKATDGQTLNDPQFAANWAGMSETDLYQGAYHFFHPDLDPVAQANFYLQALTAANGSAVLGPGCLPPALDVETANGCTAAQIVSGATQWIKLVAAATGRAPLVYTYASFWNASVASAVPHPVSPLWIAEYGVQVPRIPKGWSAYTIWQNSDHSVVAGVPKPTDGDVFNGTLAQLQALAGVTPAPAPAAAS